MKLIRPVVLTLLIALVVNTTTAQRFKSLVFDTLDSLTAIEYGKALNIKGNAESLLICKLHIVHNKVASRAQHSCKLL